MMATDLSILAEILVIGSLVILSLGYFFSSKTHVIFGKKFPEKIGHNLSIVGWLLLGFFWWIQVEHYILANDPVNGFICALAMPFFGYLAIHEYLSIRWNSKYEPLRWLAAMTVVAGGIYFFVERVPILSGWLIQVVAEQSIWILNSFDFSTSLGSLDYGEGSRYYRPVSENEEVLISVEAGDWRSPDSISLSIVLACTALQSMIIFVGGVVCTKAPLKRRFYAFLATVPAIYLLNLIRNAGVIWLTYEHIWGDDTFFLAHSVLGKVGSLIALVFLAIAVFHFLPEMQESILGVIDLPLRKAPEGFRGLPFAKGMPSLVGYAFVTGLVLFPFGFFSVSVKEQGFDSNLPLESMYLVSIAILVVSLFLLYFYRDPQRTIESGIVSPADGLVQRAEIKKGMVYFSIFMNVHNVHVNRSPFDGRVISIKHKSGGYLPAFSKDSDKNERLLTKIETSIGVMKVVQIAGVLVRRIVSYVKPNSEVEKGERIGLIHFGSRVDLSFESAGIDISVKKGDKVLAGQKLANYTPLSSLSASEKIFEVPKRIFSKLQASQNGD
ncbi:MAG: archaeosortase A [Candidatus Thermoplasmatota archaeon]|nr:archaeosortase A [Candidatus Thermoplasmatota archaeon]MEC7349844.1 archaeosortase A [Candidatus Thermoplasmatota archaeon]MEC7493812.1 archaeosortase A [Candidatus Thermoplasmatota archaeon]MEC7976819.1 archaeosortase A [Candidatus Thermoplasmatota archaeon]MEC8073923.1 archaeosortase A [Candidatus Thermoplasmatota archaeon]